MFTIYVVTNLVNGKVYVGQTTKTGKERFQSHWWSRNKKDYFHYALNKYETADWEVEDVEVFETREEVNNAEKLWILYLRSSEKKFGYNSTLGGDYGAIPNDETKAKIGAASSQRTHTPETRQKMSEAHSGEKNHLYGLPPEQQPWFGKKLSDVHKKKCSEARIAWWERKRAEGYDFSAYSNKMSKSRKGQKRVLKTPEEFSAKMSELAKKRWEKQKANPDSPATIGKPKKNAA